MNQPKPTPEKAHMELRCRVDPSLLGLLRDFVCSVARHLGFTEQEVSEIEISVDEACANAMEHAYQTAGTPPDHDVQVELYLSPDNMMIRISDTGAGKPDFDHPMDMESYLDLNREKFRGLGLVLMRKFMDDVQIFAQPNQGTIVEMTKRKH